MSQQTAVASDAAAAKSRTEWFDILVTQVVVATCPFKIIFIANGDGN